jgi:hypothetical protein
VAKQEKSFYAYTHSRPDGSVFYVGKGTGRRAWNFTHGRNPHHRSIIKKHGAENIIVTIHPCADEAAAFELEMKLIAEHTSLANMTDGGEGASGRPISDKVRAAFDEYRKTAPPRSDEMKRIASETMRRNWETNPAMMENALAMAEKRRGVKRPAHVVAALVAVHKGRKYTGERLEQIRAAQAVAQEAAKAWHSSEEGRKWHEEHGKKTWANREWVECKCQECGRAFSSPYPSRAKYCDRSCGYRAQRRKQGKPVGVRSKRVPPAVLSGKRVVGEQQ